LVHEKVRRSWMTYWPVRYAGDIIRGGESGGVFGGSISSGGGGGFVVASV
jgi:hypothetical protein